MFAIVTTKEMPYQNAFARWRTRRAPLYSMDTQYMGETKLAYLSVHRQAGGAGRYEQGLHQGLTALCEAGIRMVVPLSAFEGMERLPDYGLHLPSAGEVFLRYLPNAAVWFAKEQPKIGVRVAILGSHVSPLVERIVMKLLPFMSTLLLSCGRDTEPYCYQLRRDYGLAAQAHPSKAQFARGDIIISLLPWDQPFVPSNSAVLLLTDYDKVPSCRLVDGVQLGIRGAPGSPVDLSPEDKKMWQHALLLSGAVSPKQVVLQAPTWKGFPVDRKISPSTSA